MASSVSIASKVLVHVHATPPGSSISHSYYMDISHDQDTFHCKLFTTARSADSDKKSFVYLILDATNVKAISLNGNDEVPSDVAKGFVKQARSTAATDLVSLQFTLTQNVPVVIPDLVLQYKPSSVKDVATLLRLGRCQTFIIHVPSEFVNRERLSSLCDALERRAIKPAERIIKTLYAGTGCRIVTHIDEIWSPNPPSPPPYEFPTAPGASNDEPTNQSEPIPSNSPRCHGKRRPVSPDLLNNPSKRQLLTENAAAQPWELAIAAQGAQIAALRTELSGLREQVQELQRAPGVDAETQTDPVVEDGLEIFPRADPSDEAHTPASTVEDSIHDHFTMFEEIFDEKFEENIDEIFNKKIEGRLYKLEIDVLNEQALRWQSEGRLGAKLENMRESLEQKLEDSNTQVRDH